MRTVLTSLALGGALLALLPRADAQILSPGKLGRSHSELEGLRNCTKCHELGKKVDGALCLDCHKPLAAAIKAGKGLHAAQSTKKRACTECHTDHRGVEGALSTWQVPKKRFDHAQTGYKLTNKHAKAECAACHRAELVAAPKLKERLRAQPEATYLGLGHDCSSCHFDEHRRQLGNKCESCHDTRAFKPAPEFKHEKSWPLNGAHAKTDCIKCHPVERDSAAHSGIPAPKEAAKFSRFKPLKGTTCISCHRDVHAGKFGSACQSCHSEASWTRTRLSAGDIAFHQKSRFPLKGRHQETPCKNCHPVARGKMQSRGFAFAHCNDCHIDAHFAQMPKEKDGFIACQRCHNEEGFFPPRFPSADHQKGRYPLEGAHRVVACNGCHLPNRPLFAKKLPADIGDPDKPRRRTQLVNFTQIRMPDKDLKACHSCHRDLHAGQFATSEPKLACSKCHQLDAFSNERFDHSRDSSFALEGKHAKVACEQCHRPTRDGAPIVYRGLAKRCSDCHADAHLGQFAAGRAEPEGCASCHTPKDFKPTTFSHDDEKRALFALTGKHREVKCEKCHPKTRLDSARETVWYRGVPTRCAGCHVNVHAQGAGKGGAR